MPTPVWPVGTNTALRPASLAARTSSSPTLILPIAQSEPTVWTTLTGRRMPAPLGVVRSSGTPRRSRSSRPCSFGRRDEVGVGGQLVVQAGLDVEAGAQRLEQRRLPGRRQAAARRRDADDQARRAEVDRLLQGRHDRDRPRGERHDLVGRAPRGGGVDHRDDVALAVADDPVAGLAVGVREQALGVDRETVAHCVEMPRPGASDSTRRPSSKPMPENGSSGEQQRAVEVDEVAQGGHLRRRRDAGRALDHAAEHDPQAERAGGVHHAQRLAQAAALGELDVDAVGVAGDRGDVGQRVASLVDDDRDAAADPAEAGERVEVLGRERLLDELDVEPLEQRQELARGLERPALVGVDPEGQVARAADRLEPRDVARPAELDLEPAVARGDGLVDALLGPLDAVDPDREARLGRPLAQAEELPGRLAARACRRGRGARRRARPSRPSRRGAGGGGPRCPRARTGRRRAAARPGRGRRRPSRRSRRSGRSASPRRSRRVRRGGSRRRRRSPRRGSRGRW